ncbi:GntR family transcriptional regulator [Halomonas icarae]|uniref:FCD domain-containing protein n=1 Tax=Halomonas icarae TaxID=2691040 RepID=A0A7X4VYA2_9GAMM|nr:GntR family transcriptional regulator [Halomonas icarae]MDR5901941.1 GntR family transcriptional regulator [Halomonas icarae]NAW12562.1 FCD domain-containing protein [Halomonas icarae]
MNQRQDLVGQRAPGSRRGKGGDGAERHEIIYRSISDAIIEHRLKPGARLREDALAEVFGISRTGIRKILQRLALEQLVTLTPRRGASVTRPTAEEAHEVFAARQMVECGLMPEVARCVDEASVKTLHELSDQEQKALRKGDHSAAIRHSADFHTCLARLAGNATLAEFVERLCFRSSLILAVYGKPGHLGCETHDHATLITLLKEGRGQEAAVLMGNHLRAVEATLAIVEEDQEAPDLHQIFLS